MKLRKFGRSALEVSPLGFGAGLIGDESLSGKEVESLLHSLLDLGINLIDTARGYGLSEERIGKYISHRRNEYILSTKVGYGIEGVADWTYDCILKGVDLARKNLRTGVIDIVHLHSCSQYILENNGVLDALLECKDRGWIRIMAYSGENTDLAYALNTGMIEGIQTSINLFDQKSLNRFVPAAANLGIGVIGKRSLANVCWHYDSQPFGNYAEQYWLRMKDLQFDFGIPYNELALRFAVFSPGVTSSLIGGKNPSNIKRNLSVLEHGPLPEDIYLKIRSRFDQVGVDWEGLI